MDASQVIRYRLTHVLEVHGETDRYCGFPSDNSTASRHVVGNLGFPDVVCILARIEDVNQDMSEFNDAVADWMVSEYPSAQSWLCDTYNDRFTDFERLKDAFERWSSGDGDELNLNIAQFGERSSRRIVERVRIERMIDEE